ncbi:hypothetical protein [Chryseobacterium sp. FH1]|uniref:hypothetical protein n=1 Tax=Chryseobacterium sp. FH1 TaxID=1233951 RepID=UPI0004E28E82|nr:hypothetical protein [Chryseobacterium sp. FH1]KFC19247.1 hypothetical protein IO90_07995 [Chryseobacterium sp. FH1]
MRNFRFLPVVFSSFFSIAIWAQVGINTTEPLATLDVNGNVMIRDTPETTVLPGYKVLVVNQNSFEVGDADPSLFLSGSNSNIAKASASSGVSLLTLDLSLLYPNWYVLKFGNAEINPTLFTSTASDFYYTVPNKGKYFINLNFKMRTLLSLGVATNSQIGLLKTSGTTTTLIDSKPLSVIGLTLSNDSFETIHSVYEFEAGDKVRFVLNRGLLNLDVGVLSNSSGRVLIYKISD